MPSTKARRARVRVPNRDELRAERCRRALGTFIREAWPLVEPGEPFVDNWHIDVVAEHLEAVSRGEITRLILNVPPRSSKSLTCSVFWQAWEWLTRPEGKWLSLCYSQALSLRDASRTRRLVQHRGLRNAEPGDELLRRIGYAGLLGLLGQEWELAGDQNAKGRFENTRTGARLATSFGGVATGEGGDRILIDDPHSAKQARSDVERKAGIEWYDATVPTRLNNPDTSAIVVVMQRLHDRDLTGHLLAKGGWEHVCLPGEFERGHPHAFIADPRSEEGELLDPVRLHRKRLDELRKEMGSYGYAGQIQQRPAPRDGGIIKRAWLGGYERIPPAPNIANGKHFDAVVQSWDCAFKDLSDSDYVVGQAWGAKGADLYLLAQVRARLDYPATKQAIRDLTLWLGLRGTPSERILVEDKANGSAVVSELRREIRGLIAVEPQGGKVARAHAASPVIEGGNVLLPTGGAIPCPPRYEPTSREELVHELTTFPGGANDDQVDALTQAIVWIDAHPVQRIDPGNAEGAEAPLTSDLLEREM